MISSKLNNFKAQRIQTEYCDSYGDLSLYDSIVFFAILFFARNMVSSSTQGYIFLF